jgi:hypothetical protein
MRTCASSYYVQGRQGANNLEELNAEIRTIAAIFNVTTKGEEIIAAITEDFKVARTLVSQVRWWMGVVVAYTLISQVRG